MMVEERLQSLGYQLPECPTPAGIYIPGKVAGNILYTAGQVPVVNGVIKYPGKLGRDLTLEEGYEAARICALNGLAAAKATVGSLDRIAGVVKVAGYVNSAPGFKDQPKVLNGASELLVKLFGESGKHARSALTANELSRDAAVEIEFIFQLHE